MYGDAAGERRVVVDVDVAAQQGAVGDDDVVAERQSWATWEQAIRKLWSPIAVTPSSFSVARLIVTPSRITLWSPITTRVGARCS